MDIAFYDRTARGRIIVAGRDRLDLLHRLGANSILGLEPGRGTACCFTTNKGRLIDWTVVVNRGDDVLILSANPERLSGHIQQYTITEDITVRNYMAIEIVVCGPGAAGLIGLQLEPWQLGTTGLGGVQVEVVRIEPLLGEAYAVLAPDAVALRRVLADRGTALDADGVAALRIRSGIPAFPNEINEERNPWEAGLDASLSLHKGCYVGQEIIARLHTYDKVKNRLVRVSLAADAAEGDPLRLEGEEVGTLTTVAGREALAYVRAELATPGQRLDAAEVVSVPAN